MVQLTDRGQLALIHLESMRDGMSAMAPMDGVLGRSIDDFNRLIDTLETELPGISAFRFDDDERQYRYTSGRQTVGGRVIKPAVQDRSGPGYVLWQQFGPKLNGAVRYARQKTSGQPAGATTAAAVLGARERLLADLIDAYLRVQEDFSEHVVGDDETWLFHDGFQGGHIVPNWSHVRALARDGFLHRTPDGPRGDYTISIATKVLSALNKDTPGIEGKPPSQERSDAIAHTVVNITGGANQNISINGTNFTQTVSSGVQPGDVAGLIAGLRGIGMDDDHLADLQASLTESDGTESQGEVARGWFRQYLLDVAAEVTGAGAIAVTTIAPKALPMIEAFARTVV